MAATSATNSGLALSGLASGLNWTNIVNEMLTIEAAPETQMTAQKTTDQQKNTAFQTIGTDLTALQKDVNTLSVSSFFDSRTTSVSNPSVASATASSSTPLGSYTFNVTQLASDAVQLGSAASSSLSPTNDVSSLVLSSAGFATPVTAGTFTVNGQTVTIATSDTLQSVFDKINTATSGAVTGGYNSTTDEITLANTDPTNTSAIVLGSATDTSNFLQSAELYNNGTGTVVSAAALGGVNLSNTLNNANLSTAISDGGSGAGQFLINGVAINFNASTDTVTSVLQRINNSAAGVTATYDSLDDRFQLTNNSTGDMGVTLQDVTGNFLAASGLSSGTLQRGNNLQYSINGGGTLTSQSNTVNGGASGVAGLSITAAGKGLATISVGTDTSTISSAINSFVTDYNAVQNYISSQTTPTTSSTGTVTPGLLTGNLDVENIVFTLRQLAGGSPGTTAGVQSLNDLGVLSNGTDNTLAMSSTTALDSALTNNLAAVKSLFTDSTTGIAKTLTTFLNKTTSLTGILATDENSMTTEATTITNSITTLQAKLTSDQTRLTNEFTAMETAINSINAEKQYLNAYFNGSSTASSQAGPVAAGSGSSSSSSAA